MTGGFAVAARAGVGASPRATLDTPPRHAEAAGGWCIAPRPHVLSGSTAAEAPPFPPRILHASPARSASNIRGGCWNSPGSPGRSQVLLPGSSVPRPSGRHPRSRSRAAGPEQQRGRRPASPPKARDVERRGTGACAPLSLREVGARNPQKKRPPPWWGRCGRRDTRSTLVMRLSVFRVREAQLNVHCPVIEEVLEKNVG